VACRQLRPPACLHCAAVGRKARAEPALDMTGEPTTGHVRLGVARASRGSGACMHATTAARAGIDCRWPQRHGLCCDDGAAGAGQGWLALAVGDGASSNWTGTVRPGPGVPRQAVSRLHAPSEHAPSSRSNHGADGADFGHQGSDVDRGVNDGGLNGADGHWQGCNQRAARRPARRPARSLPVCATQ
jgi:hypothetical protein